jgi:signal transduction histidine kinase
MRLSLAPLKRQLPTIKPPGQNALKRDGLLFQRLFWGAAAGGLATILLAESPVLDTMEMNLLEWRYKVAHEIERAIPVLGPGSDRLRSDDINIITYDDVDQFDLEGDAQEGGPHPIQGVLARLIPIIESGNPLLVVLDIDLSGRANPDLVKILRSYKSNVVLALSGNLDNPEDFPAAELRQSVLTCAYDHVIKESNGLVCRMPISANIFLGNDGSGGKSAGGLAGGNRGNGSTGGGWGSPGDGGLGQTQLSFPGEAFESLPEVVAPLMSSRVGVGPSKSQISAFSEDQLPIYIKFGHIKYPTFRASDILAPGANFDISRFKGKVVMVGTNFSQKADNTPRVRSPLSSKVPNVWIQAEAISTLHNNEAIKSFPRSILHHLLLLLGGALGAVSSVLPLARRTTAFLTTAMILVFATQIAFMWLNLHFPILPLLAVLMLTYIFGTLIYLDTDLRLRNKELAMAREAMQVRAEEERQRIAEDLHDETLPALSSVARMADRLAQDLSDNPVPREMREKLDGAISEMRRVINDLHPSVLETMGFKPALDNLLSILSREGNLRVELTDLDHDSDGDYGLNSLVKLQLYRIVQECLNNVQKHAQATEVKLEIGLKGEDLHITIRDNGRGINPKEIKPESHGLVNIRQRAQLIGATVNWRKPLEFATGTEVALTIIVPGDTNQGQNVAHSIHA